MSQYRNQMLKANYGLTLDEVEEIIYRQGNCCAICREPIYMEYARSFHVDHDHKTRRVRGILCGPCNRGLGCFKDSISSLERAITYLKTPSKIRAWATRR